MNREELRALILQALGEASTCWSNVEQAGVFQSERAIAIAERLTDAIPLQRPPTTVIAQDHT